MNTRFRGRPGTKRPVVGRYLAAAAFLALALLLRALVGPVLGNRDLERRHGHCSVATVSARDRSRDSKIHGFHGATKSHGEYLVKLVTIG